MSVEAVKWALYEAPMLLTPAGKPDTTARFVLVVFAEHADKDGRNAYPGPARVKFVTGLDVRTVERAVRRLEDGKLLERDGFTAAGSVKWKLRVDLLRPASDWEEIEALQQAEREAVAARVRKHRSARTSEAPVTDAESVTGALVTDSASVRNGFEVRYVTDATPGEPPLEPPGTTTGGMRPPPDPLRTDSPQAACRIDQPTAPDRSKTPRTEVEQESPVPRATRKVDGRSWKRQRAATAQLDPNTRAAVREELAAQRRRAAFHVVEPLGEDSGAAS